MITDYAITNYDFDSRTAKYEENISWLSFFSQVVNKYGGKH